MNKTQQRINVLVALLASAAILALLCGVVWLAFQVPWISAGATLLTAWLGLAGFLNQQIQAAQVVQARRAVDLHLQAHDRAKQSPQERPRKRDPPPGKFPQPTRKELKAQQQQPQPH